MLTRLCLLALFAENGELRWESCVQKVDLELALMKRHDTNRGMYACGHLETSDSFLVNVVGDRVIQTQTWT